MPSWFDILLKFNPLEQTVIVLALFDTSQAVRPQVYYGAHLNTTLEVANLRESQGRKAMGLRSSD
jgi:hypothetical protein